MNVKKEIAASALLMGMLAAILFVGKDAGGESASVYIDLNGHTIEIGSSESFHFGSMACTPYSMRLWFYSTTPGAVFSGTKSEAVFYSDDDSTVTVGELDGETVQYGKNLSVYGKMVTHVNYGGGVDRLYVRDVKTK